MPHKFPTLPAPRFVPQKPSPLSQPAATPPSDAATLLTDPQPSTHNGTLVNKKKKKPRINETALVEDTAGNLLVTKLVKLVNALKAKGGPMNLSDLEAVTGVRGLMNELTDVPFNQELYDAFNAHERVHMTESGVVKVWSYKPDYVITNAEQVLEVLRLFSSRGLGMPVGTLKQSWPHVMTAITELENEGKILVYRTEGVGGKEGVPKNVFFDELGCRENLGPSRGALDEEFREMWHSLQTPPIHALPLELQEAGLTSTSSNNIIKPQSNKKSKKKSGKGGKVKITNTHLKDLGIDLSKDYVPTFQKK